MLLSGHAAHVNLISQRHLLKVPLRWSGSCEKRHGINDTEQITMDDEET